MLQQIGAADSSAVPVPQWLPDLPAIGPWIAERWQDGLARPGGLLAWTQRTDPTALLGWAQSIGRFTLRHAIIVGFTILLLFFLYREGQSLADGFGRLLRRSVGARADLYVGLATRAVRASVNSMVVVGLFDGVATGLAFALLGVPDALLWAAITGALAAVPFLGYVAVIALALRMAMMGTVTAALVALAMGCAILLVGDKIVRPAVARDGVRLRFVWVLMGCLGGFEVLGLVGVVLGPVVLTLARELWEQSGRDLERVDTTAPPTGVR
jgi:predicted PurR-regulated permease PerM